MKWLGGLVGLLFGFSIGRIDHAIGWMLGGFLAGGGVDLFRQAARASAQAPTATASAEIARVFKALEDIHWRLKRLEDQATLPVSPMERGADAASEPAPTLSPAQQYADTEPVVDRVAATASSVAVDARNVAFAATSTVSGWSSPVPAPAPVAGAPALAGDSPFELARRWLFGGNTMLKVGIIILFFGVAFLVKYAADSGVLPIELRLAGIAAGGIAMLVAGFRLRQRTDGKAQYGLALQGAGIGILYLAIFGAFRFYQLLPGGFALVLMVAVVGLSAALAVMQNSLALAAFGSVGGFLAPVLASTGGGSHIALFSFYALLNIGIFAIAWFRSWRILNLIGFVFTFGIGAVWGARAYRPEHFATTEPFLILFFLFYVAIATLYALREAPRLRTVVDGTLVFGTPVVAFGLQTAIVKDMSHAAAFSALALAVFYLFLARWLLTRHRETLRLLSESFLALGVVFITLAVPLAFDGRWTSATWAMEGAAIVWAGSRQGKLLARAFGYLVQAGGALTFLAHLGDGERPALPVLNAHWLGLALIAAAALFTAHLISHRPERFNGFERGAAPPVFIVGVVAWLLSGITEIDWWSGRVEKAQSVALLLAGSACLFHCLARRLAWQYAARVPLALLPALLPVILHAVEINHHPFALLGWLIWPLALATHFYLLGSAEAASVKANPGYLTALHAIGIWVPALLGAVELHWLVQSGNPRHSAWSVAAAMLPVALTVVTVSSAWLRRRWPINTHPVAVLVWGAAPLMALLWLWVFYSNFSHDGSSAPLPYLPLLNAIDLGHVLAILALLAWQLALKAEAIELRLPRVALVSMAGVAGFVWLNGMLLRTIHHWADVPYRLETLLRSVLTQTALSIFWTVLALGLMLYATCRTTRAVWLVGAALMAAVVAKLFLIDLSNIGGIERIVSFIGVGLLMLVIGYVAPLPPKRVAGSNEDGGLA